MNFKEMIRFAYGLFMGTSTPFLKPTKRFLYPVHRHEFDSQLGLFLGGSGVCGVLSVGAETLVINTNQGPCAGEFANWVRERSAPHASVTLVLSSTAADFSRGMGSFLDVSKLLVGPTSNRALRDMFGEVWESLGSKCQILREPVVLTWGDERIHLIPVGPAATESDLVVFLEKRSVLFLGALFYNHIHPILRAGPNMRPEKWVTSLEELMQRYQAKFYVPAEGDLGSVEDVREFIRYLKTLMDPAVEFSKCRNEFDWPEIPSYTSLEENFDLLREKVKSHTSLS